MEEWIPASGYFYPSKMGRLYLISLQEVMGRNGLNALLNLVGLPQYIERLPADTLEPTFDFAHISNLNHGLTVLYGPRGGRGLALRCGRAFFTRGLRQFGALVGVSDLALRTLPLQTKLKLGLGAIARIFTQFSDQISRVEEANIYFDYHVDACPICWGRTAVQPIDQFTAGILQEGLHWMSGGLDFRVEQMTCKALGDENCAFRIGKEPIK